MKALKVLSGMAIFLVFMSVNAAIASTVCTGAPDGTPCDDGNACTTNDTCQGGFCVGTPVVCTASDQCHVAGVCNSATGVCSNPQKANGTACSDGNACTQNDTCQSGTCVSGTPVVCTASDQCHAAGTCDTTTGLCSNPAKPDGTACNDGNACTQTDTCQAGTCLGGNPVICTATDQCHAAGTCDPTTGICSNPTAQDGTACNDGNACTQTDTCRSGVCTGGNPVVCTASDQCHVAGTCNPATGACSNPTAPNGTACNDGNACTQTDTCQAGICTGGNPVVCSATDLCHASTCDPSYGICTNPLSPSFAVVGGSTFTQSSLELAYDALQSGETMEVQAVDFTENTVLQKNLAVTLVGGYACDFSSNAGYSTITGSLTIGDGTVVLRNFIVQ